MKQVAIRIFYPADPVGLVPGGVDTFIRGIVKFAPADIAVSLVGMTTDPETRPQGRWTRCRIGTRDFDFFPVVCVENAGGRLRIPLSLRFSIATAQNMRYLRSGFDVFEFHRIEPALLFLSDSRPKNAFFHQDMTVIRNKGADIIWRRMPAMYFAIERRVIGHLDSAWCVSQEGVRVLRERYPAKASVIGFIPTWVDTEIFSPIGEAERKLLRLRFGTEFGISGESTWVISVGRLDSQKAPELLLSAVARLRAAGVDVNWIAVGDGVLRPTLEREVSSLGLERSVRFLGLKRPAEIAELLRAADVFALSSIYEGMPMALLEALGCGLPVVTTNVGEVGSVVRPGVNGTIATDCSEEGFARSLGEVVAQRARLNGIPAVNAIQKFQPAQVLAAVYENYRELAQRQQHRQAPRTP